MKMAFRRSHHLSNGPETGQDLLGGVALGGHSQGVAHCSTQKAASKAVQQWHEWQFNAAWH